MIDLLEKLNPEQRKAVEHVNGPLLVLAGAGSGKTRVITHRIAKLIAGGVRPWNILAVTFTNKAAGEMLSRLRELVGEDAAGDAWVSTFHAAGVRILRRDGHKIGLPRNFTIFDEADQLALLKRVLRELGIDEKKLPPRDVATKIDQFKNQGVLPHEARRPSSDPFGEEVVRAYRRYEDALQAQGAVDFGDLLLRVVQLLRDSPDTRAHYQRRFHYLLVDEFQDTNPVQYELLRLLCPDDRSRANLCVVGDDDQSIYRWRGAEVENILRFEQDFPGTVVVKLERNYRSTPRILDAAHGVISHNRVRAAKKLWTEGEPGDRLRLCVAADDREEAQRVASWVVEERARGRPGIAVFYRTNAQSRLLEEALRQRAVPYQIVRGQSFYDRAEIRDLVAWLRLLQNPKGDEDFLRAVAMPPRGIGDTTLDKLAAHARAKGVSLFDACADLDGADGLNAGAKTRLVAFRDQVAALAERGRTQPARDVAKAVAHETGFLERLKVDPRGEGEERVENVLEFIRAADDFDRAWTAVVEPRPDAPAPVAGRRAGAPAGDPAESVQLARAATLRALRGDLEDEPPTPLQAFLQTIAVLGDADEDAPADRVALMTLHAAKGLEFDVVFITGLEENIFPGTRSMQDEGGIAEERRLCYVGITRGRRRVYLTLARSRALFGELRFNEPSRFLHEIPHELVEGMEQLARRAPTSFTRADRFSDRVWDEGYERARPRKPAPSGEYVEREDDGPRYDDFDQRPVRTAPPPLRPPASPARPAGAATATAKGKVRHDQFGVGTVVARQGEGANAKVTVLFPGIGVKTVIARFLDSAD